MRHEPKQTATTTTSPSVARGSFIALLMAAVIMPSAGCGSGGDSNRGARELGRFEDETLFSDGSVNPSFLDLNVGETNTNLGMRSGVTFDILGFSTGFLLGIPANATVITATLRATQADTIGSPFAMLGEIVVDHVDYGLELDAGDFFPSIREANIGTLATDDTPGVKTLDVTAQVAADLAAQRRSNFLLRFNGNFGSNTAQYVQFTEVRLYVEYTEN